MGVSVIVVHTFAKALRDASFRAVRTNNTIVSLDLRQKKTGHPQAMSLPIQRPAHAISPPSQALEQRQHHQPRDETQVDSHLFRICYFVHREKKKCGATMHRKNSSEPPSNE